MRRFFTILSIVCIVAGTLFEAGQFVLGIRAEFDGLREQVATLTREKAELEGQHGTVLQELKTARADRDRERERRGALEGKLSVYEGRVAELDQALRDSHEMRQALLERLAEVQRKAASGEIDETLSEFVVGRLKEQLAELNADGERLREELGTAQEDLATTRTELELAETRIRQAEGTIDELLAHNVELVEKAATLEQQRNEAWKREGQARYGAILYEAMHGECADILRRGKQRRCEQDVRAVVSEARGKLAFCAVDGGGGPVYLRADQARVELLESMAFEGTRLPSGGLLLTCDPALVDSL